MIRAMTAECIKRLGEFRRREDGQVAVMFALTIIPIIGAVGAAVDYTRGTQVRTSLLKALDAAVLAAAIDSTANWNEAATSAFSGNLKVTGTTVSAPTFSFEKGIYTGTVTATTDTDFIKLAGVSTLTVKANAAATTANVPLCVLGLNSLETGAFDMNGNAKFYAPTCAVQANTKANKGMTQEGKPTATAKRFGVSGAHTGEGYSTPPKDNSPAVPDPYASIPFPSYTPCDSQAKGLTINGGVTTLSPGTYCGGIRIKAGATVTLESGIYVMVDGSFWLDGGSAVNGKEVVIAFTGNDTTLRVWGNSTINLTSPVSGLYKNFQFFQDPNDQNGRGAWVSIGGNGNTDDSSKATWDGIAYFPTQNFWVYGNAVANLNSPNMALVAAQIWVQGNATMNVTNENTRNLSVTQTTIPGGARLVQ